MAAAAAEAMSDQLYRDYVNLPPPPPYPGTEPPQPPPTRGGSNTIAVAALLDGYDVSSDLGQRLSLGGGGETASVSNSGSTSKTAAASLLSFNVTPPKSTGPSEAERKLEAMTEEIAQEMEKREELEYLG